VGFYGGPLSTVGAVCKVEGEVAHTADGQRLVCHIVSGSAVLGASELASTTAPTEVEAATATNTAADGQLPLTGAKSLTTLAIAVLVLGVGLVLRRRASTVLDHRAWLARRKDPSRPTWKPQEPDDRWHW